MFMNYRHSTVHTVDCLHASSSGIVHRSAKSSKKMLRDDIVLYYVCITHHVILRYGTVNIVSSADNEHD